MDLYFYIRAIFAFLFVIGLLILARVVLKKYLEGKNFLPKKNSEKRVSIEQILPIDTRRKIILVKRDDVEHLILLGHEKDLLIESNIVKKKKNKK